MSPRRDFSAWALWAGLMRDVKDGVPRGAFQGVVKARRHGAGRTRMAADGRGWTRIDVDTGSVAWAWSGRA